ncbi:MAG TPA: hypothetical protein EYQ70_02410 [Marine Group III euryarchaeote]|uniref:H/ACA RNA-protein complex protein Gar1 n=1 Tax=Marine Group III euryarchaeote TaxID=2173149 RepID=A0A7J4GRV6_9ARCH|nr:hypothetical protein [Marine Group III euryarchaeote]
MKKLYMICLGKVSHLNTQNLAIVLAKEKVNKNTKIFDSEMKLVGRVVNIFGPVKQPYLAISANKGFRITRLVGREVYRK